MKIEEPLLMFVAALVATTIYIPFFLVFARQSKLKFARRRFLRGLLAIMTVSDEIEAVPQVLRLYRRLGERYPILREHLRSANEMLEDLLTSMDTSPPKSFKEIFSLDPPTELRSKMVSILSLLEERQPFSAVSSKQGNLLGQLKLALETGNRDLGASILSQVGGEFELLEGSLRQQERRGRLAFTVSIIGAILTLFFGLVSFIQFFAQLKS